MSQRLASVETANSSAVQAPQVLKLCRKHRLLSALVYMFTRGLQDYIAPAVELLMAQLTVSIEASTASAEDHHTAKPTNVSAVTDSRSGADGYKLLVYVRCCLRGQQFPPGAGPLPASQAGITKAAMLGASSDAYAYGKAFMSWLSGAAAAHEPYTCRIHAVHGEQHDLPVMASVRRR